MAGGAICIVCEAKIQKPLICPCDCLHWRARASSAGSWRAGCSSPTAGHHNCRSSAVVTAGSHTADQSQQPLNYLKTIGVAKSQCCTIESNAPHLQIQWWCSDSIGLYVLPLKRGARSRSNSILLPSSHVSSVVVRRKFRAPVQVVAGTQWTTTVQTRQAWLIN